jgi:hypothetical protein
VRLSNSWIVATLLALAAVHVAAQNAAVGVTARVSSVEVYTGQSLMLEIDVDGSDSPSAPDLSVLEAGFTIQDAGGGARSSRSVSFINGRMTTNVELGFTFRYQIAPRREGDITIPSVAVTVDGRELRTQPIPIRVVPPTELRDFKLRATLSSTSGYVGQPILLTTTWYLSRNVDQVLFGMPLLDDDRFEVLDLPVDRSGANDEFIDLIVNNRIAVARQHRGSLDGREFIAVSFVKVVIPKQPGRFELPSSTASFRAARTVRSTSSGFGGFFGGPLGQRTIYEDLAIPSNRPVLEVSALPIQGRPADFSGLVGSFALTAKADPIEVRVGDPINLEITLSGPDYLDYARLPHLSSNRSLDENFVIPTERPVGVVHGGVKLFSQAVRAKNINVTEIPALELNYFDPATQSYAVARTEPIPLSVDATRMLTSADLGDLGGPNAVDRTAPPSLAANFEGLEALRSPGKGLFLGTLALPPLLFGLILLVRRGQNRATREIVNVAARHALEQLQALSVGTADDVARLLREYVAAKGDLSAHALTYPEVDPSLVEAGASQQLRDDLRQLFVRCDEAQFAGGAADTTCLRSEAIQICLAMESLEGLR